MNGTRDDPSSPQRLRRGRMGGWKFEIEKRMWNRRLACVKEEGKLQAGRLYHVIKYKSQTRPVLSMSKDACVTLK
ncbi:MAG: hypothetical protein A2X48_22960 [Lentisphaerae bacterium GWF2_49_21]|nr:MAG: hypothetical protein A2X48_22960 [Lentisphaerae bacterium GWF2_49_21]